MAFEGYLEERLAQIAVEREEVLARLGDIRAKMARADERKSGQADTPNYKKWSSVYRGLEHELDKHKAILASLDAESREKTSKLERLQAGREVYLHKLKLNYDRIMSLPPEEMAHLTAEDMTLLQEYEQQLAAAENHAATESEQRPASLASTRKNLVTPKPAKYVTVTEFKRTPEKPKANECSDPERASESAGPPAPPQRGSGSSGPTTEEPAATEKNADPTERRKRAFQSALQKSGRGSISEMTFEEVAVMLTAYRKILSQTERDAASESLEKNISGALWEVHTRCARICANWAELVRRDSAKPNRAG